LLKRYFQCAGLMPAREINVYCINENPKISREELKFATKFMYSLLVSRKMHDATNIWVESREIYDKQKMDGRASVKGDSWAKSPMDFNILLNTRSSKRIQLLTLAHELVHVKQFSKNQLGRHWEEDGINYVIWKKRRVNVDKKSYWFLDWEVEAFGKQEGLYHSYKTFLKEHKIKF
jgi:hypothetical protein